MATQLADTGADAGADDHNDNTSIDYEAEASKFGWKPPEQLKDPSKGVDAKTFYERGQEVMPLLKAQNRALERRLEIAERNAKQAAEFFSKAEERAYDRALIDIRAKMEDAVESGDIKAHREAADALTKLEKPGAALPPSAPVDPAQRAEEFADWMTDNRWYASPELQALRIYADAQADKIIKANENAPLSRADLDEVAARVKTRFAESYPEAFGAPPKPKPRNPVDGGGTPPARRSGRSFADLPPEAQAACDKWVKNGIIKSRDDYVKAYDFGDRK